MQPKINYSNYGNHICNGKIKGINEGPQKYRSESLARLPTKWMWNPALNLVLALRSWRITTY